MAYLTKYNLSKLCQKLQVNEDISLETFIKYIYDDKEIFFILNKVEIEYLFIYRMLLADEKSFFINYYKEIPEGIDTKTMVFNKGGKVKYHLTSKCELLSKDYLDFNIPRDILKISKERKTENIIQEYRSWFENMKFAEKYKNQEITKESIIRRYNLKYCAKYDVKEIVEDSNILIVEAKNSNNQSIKHSFDVNAFKKELKEAKLQWQNVFNCKTNRIIAKFKNLENKSDEEISDKMTQVFSSTFVKNYKIRNFRDKFSTSKKLTRPIIKLILEYLKWSYNLDTKDFDKITLENFGLQCCYVCKKKATLQ